MALMKTPGVYVVEKNAFPNSVVEAPTAVPAFIGYTEKAENGNKSLLNIPWRITSMAEYQLYFGGAPVPKFTVKYSKKPGQNAGEEGEIDFDKKPTLDRQDQFTFYYNLMLFFANGGGACYIVSVGNYTAASIEKTKLEGGITPLIKEQEPTMVVIPEAVNLAITDCYALQTAMLSHCGSVMKNRFAVLDVYHGKKDLKDVESIDPKATPPIESSDVVTNFREQIGTNFLDYGAAYYPWLNTSIVQENELSFLNLDLKTDDDKKNFKAWLEKDLGGKADALKSYLSKFAVAPSGNNDEKPIEIDDNTIHKVLSQSIPAYAEIIKEMKDQLNLLPVSAAMAGVYTMVDNSRGVWKAPANVSIVAAVSPAVNISQEEQEDLNVPVNGKSVNAIRFFTGEGIKVWGARTLDGNSLDWRYINVRRTMIMLEESVKNAAKAYVFEPNEANTWVNMKSMISNFLNGIWKRGGLAGAVPDDAYSVHVGLGETMTPEDILEGIMRITVLVAISHPAEFIEITFQQQMQKS